MERTYARTHPWVTFSLPSKPFPSSLWLLLGEAQSKIEHLAGTPLRPETADKLHRLYLAKGVRATTAIEGNTLSQEDVEKHLAGELHLPPSKQYMQREVANIVEACNDIGTALLDGSTQSATVETIKEYNRRVLAGLDLQDGVVPGEIRAHNVGVLHYRGAPPEDCEYLLDRLCTWLREIDGDKPEWITTGWAVLRATVAHLYLAWIHPFGDGNGRTARLLEFGILVDSGVPTPAAHLLSNHYNETRSQYYLELDRASKSGGDIAPFLLYAVRGFVDGLREQINQVRAQQFDIVWQNVVHNKVSQSKPSPARDRRRHLIMAISRNKGFTPVSELMTLNTRVAREYATRTTKTLSRDLGFLKRLDLVVISRGRVRARQELVRAFVPARKNAAAAAANDPAPSAGIETRA